MLVRCVADNLPGVKMLLAAGADAGLQGYVGASVVSVTVAAKMTSKSVAVIEALQAAGPASSADVYLRAIGFMCFVTIGGAG